MGRYGLVRSAADKSNKAKQRQVYVSRVRLVRMITSHSAIHNFLHEGVEDARLDFLGLPRPHVSPG